MYLSSLIVWNNFGQRTIFFAEKLCTLKLTDLKRAREHALPKKHTDSVLQKRKKSEIPSSS